MKLRVALLALACSAAPLAQQADTTRNPLGSGADAVAAGRRLYDQTCQSCHGAGGRGDRGPALDSGRFTRGSADGDLFHTIRAGVPGSQMPPFPALSDTQIWQVVSYIRSLAPAASTDVAVAGDPRAGETLFFGKAACAACHEINGRGGIVGPDLSAAERIGPAQLRAKILDPSAPPAAPNSRRPQPPPQTLVATFADGRELRGVRRNEDTFSAQLVDAAGVLHLLDKTTLKAYRVENRSLMPDDYRTRLAA